MLQIGNPYKLVLLGCIDGNDITERALHKRFAELKIRGEWFSPSEKLVSFIAALQKLVLKAPVRAITRVSLVGAPLLNKQLREPNYSVAVHMGFPALAVEAWKKLRECTDLHQLTEAIGAGNATLWPAVPKQYLAAVSEVTKLTPQQLRPDIYFPDPWTL